MTDKPKYRLHADKSVSLHTQDGLANLVSGLGTSRDKAGQAAYYVSMMSDQELLTAYTASNLVARVVDMPAADATREWREWSAETVETTLIEKEELRLGLQLKVHDAQRMARLFGGAAIYISADASDPEKPLDPRRVGAKGLMGLTVLTMRNLSPGPLSEVLGDNFGKPEYWQLNTRDKAGQRIHPSRLAVFHGVAPMRDYGIGLHTGWGHSVLQGGLEAIKRVGEVAGNTNSLVYEAKVDVFGIPDLMANLSTRGDSYAAEVIRRTTLAATAKGINGMLLRDAEETYEQKSASFGTLDTILDRMMQLACAEYGIPMTLLFGMSPGGMNATGASDTRGYYDNVRVVQAMHMGPAMSVLDECLIRSALGDRPDDVNYNWRPLWQSTALEKAQVGKLIVDAIVSLEGADIVPSRALGLAAVSALTESGAFPGLEAAVADEGGIVDPGNGAGDDPDEDTPAIGVKT